jgi:hypothetical protein
MVKWVSIAIFFIAMVVMYLIVGTDAFKTGEREEKKMQQEVQQEKALIDE